MGRRRTPKASARLQTIADFSACLGFDCLIVCSVSSRPTDDDTSGGSCDLDGF